MDIEHIIFLGCIALLMLSQGLFAQEPQVSYDYDQEQLRAANAFFELVIDLQAGHFTIIDTSKNQPALDNAQWKVGDLVSGDRELRHQWFQGPVVSPFGEGSYIRIESEKSGGGRMIWQADIYENQPALILRAGFMNTTPEPVYVGYISPLEAGDIFPGMTISENLAMLDGNGGGERTHVIRDHHLQCRNNVLATFGSAENPCAIVAGGLTYTDYEKFATLRDPWFENRRTLLAKALDAPLLCYLNLPDNKKDISPAGPSLEYVQGRSYAYSMEADYPQELKTIAFHPRAVILQARGLDPAKTYQLGFSWWDEKIGRVQSVYAQPADGKEEEDKVALVKNQMLPQWGQGNQGPQQLTVTIPRETYTEGDVRFLFELDATDEHVVNAVVSEVWLREVKAETPLDIAAIAPGKPQPVRALQAGIYAHDKVGKRVEPTVTYLPDDLFYVDVTTGCPFASLEKYGKALRIFQGASPNVYDFPTVCLWYAMLHVYGGGPAINDSRGAVEEMQRIKDSGFLKYARAAVRLVPDHYGHDNEQGWWDEKHWQMYGWDLSMYAPEDQENKVPRMHYTEPYETTAKWAGAIRDLGGIPLTYFQTCFRSEDYAHAHPEHMLFNKAVAPMLDSQGKPMNFDREKHHVFQKSFMVWSYDFTDPDFLRHMKEVYYNLRSGGVRGLMFDYPYTGWADGGGMEDAYSTVGAAYRNIFYMAKHGLGEDSWVHERNLARGSDITLGIVDSQRTWDDTDKITAEMASFPGLRWYKNRVVVNYDMDAKNLLKTTPNNRDGVRSLLTVCYTTSGRLLLGNSFGRLSKENIYDLSRIYPFHRTPQSARPVDAFISTYPLIYDFKINDAWHQVTFYNAAQEEKVMQTSMSGPLLTGSLGLDSRKEYYVYDFWNDTFGGKLAGSQMLTQTLRPGESRMLSVREVMNHPQVLSTNRHIMQGYVDLHDVRWDDETQTLRGKADVVGGETYQIIIALNGHQIKKTLAGTGTISLSDIEGNPQLAVIRLDSADNALINWSLGF